MARKKNIPYDKGIKLSNHELLYGQPREIIGKEIPWELYANIQGLFPIDCVDVFITNPKDEILLGRRKTRPAKGLWWPPGGRRFRNERLGVAAARHCKKDTGLSIDPSRFVVLDHDILFFEDREQEPVNVGTDSPVTLMGVQLTHEEAEKVQQIGELEKMIWMPIRDILLGNYDEHVKKGAEVFYSRKAQKLYIGSEP